MDALLALEGGQSIGAERDGLAGAHGHASFVFALGANGEVAEVDVIGESGRGLDFAAHQQRVLVGHEQAAVEGDLRPAAGAEQGVVEGAAVLHGELGGGAAGELSVG